MVKRIGGNRRKSRARFTKHYRRKGKISFTRFFQKLNIDDSVTLLAETAYQRGMYVPRFHGKHATVVGQQGKCYKVRISDGNAKKVLIVHPVHLRLQNGKAAVN